jgi:hypothetical protein
VVLPTPPLPEVTTIMRLMFTVYDKLMLKNDDINHRYHLDFAGDFASDFAE